MSAVWGKENRECGDTLGLLRFMRDDPLSKGILSGGVAERALGKYGMGYSKAGFGLFAAMRTKSWPVPVAVCRSRQPADSSSGEG